MVDDFANLRFKDLPLQTINRADHEEEVAQIDLFRLRYPDLTFAITRGEKARLLDTVPELGAQPCNDKVDIAVGAIGAGA